MKVKMILFMMIALFLLGGVGCEKDDKIPLELIGTWKLEGFGNTTDNSLIRINPAEYRETDFRYIFSNNAMFEAYSNRLYRASIHVQVKNNTILFREDPDLIWSLPLPADINVQLFEKRTRIILYEIEATFKINDTKLIIFYTDTEFLQFYRISS